MYEEEEYLEVVLEESPAEPFSTSVPNYRSLQTHNGDVIRTLAMLGRPLLRARLENTYPFNEEFIRLVRKSMCVLGKDLGGCKSCFINIPPLVT